MEGSTIAGLMECFGTVVSVGLQHGVPLRVLCGKLSHTRFEPSGSTGNQELGYAKSIMDYLFRWMELRFLSGKQLPLFVAKAAADKNAGDEPNQLPASLSPFPHESSEVGDAPLCSTCGSLMVPNGSCSGVEHFSCHFHRRPDQLGPCTFVSTRRCCSRS
jgi:ribonucleoside-diphosphate reductase alpha chain